MTLPSPCRSCGHSLLQHERVSGTHGWICFGVPAEGVSPCECEVCSITGTPNQCACRCYSPVLAEKDGAP